MNDVRDMSAAERRLHITRLITEQGMVRSSELMMLFDISDTSIRRDLNILEDEGHIKRVHGGAIANTHDRTASFIEKMRDHLAEKQRIGQAAAQLIHEREAILFDSGTTTLQVAMHIPKHLRTSTMLTIVTNSIALVEEVRIWPSSNLVLLGGMYLPDYHATVGPQAIEQLQKIMADKVFLGAEGLTVSEGITTAHTLMAEVDGTMARRAQQVIVTTDSSKLGRPGVNRIISLDKIDLVITDTGAPKEIVDAIREQGVEVWVV